MVRSSSVCSALARSLARWLTHVWVLCGLGCRWLSAGDMHEFAVSCSSTAVGREWMGSVAQGVEAANSTQCA